jgi:hypothetical protein
MKSIKVLFVFGCLFLLGSTSLFAQVPQAFSYQAVARDANGEIKANADIQVQVRILQGSENGSVLYTETHSVQTSEIGSFSLEIGRGTSSDSFSEIDWLDGPHYLSMGVDLDGGSTFVDVGSTKLLSVPFALVSGSSAAPTEAVASGESSNIGFTGTARIGDDNNFEQIGLLGEVEGNGTGNHIGVLGSVINREAPAGATSGNAVARKYGIYGQVASKAQENIGAFGIALGDGSGDITNSDSPNPGSVNVGSVGFARDNLNFNMGVRGFVTGSQGARESVGVQGFVETTASGRNIGVQSIAARSQTRNIGYFGAIGNQGNTPENYGMLLYVQRGGVSIGAEIHADKALVAFGDVEVSGNISYTGNLTQTSDINLKENIKPITSGLDVILELEPLSYNYKWSNNGMNMRLSKNLHYGLVAQDVESILPALVQNNIHRYQVQENNPDSMTPDGTENLVTKEFEYKSLNYTELIPFLIKAVQEQQEMINAQQKELEELKKRLNDK